MSGGLLVIQVTSALILITVAFNEPKQTYDTNEAINTRFNRDTAYFNRKLNHDANNFPKSFYLLLTVLACCASAIRFLSRWRIGPKYCPV